MKELMKIASQLHLFSCDGQHYIMADQFPLLKWVAGVVALASDADVPPTRRLSEAEQLAWMRVFVAAPKLFLALERLLASPDLNLDSLEEETIQAIEQARLALDEATREQDA